MKLLIADDDPRIRAVLRQLCSVVATETRDCADGKEAIETFESFKPDWTIMDLSMPHVDGLDATKQIVTTDPEARIVMISQHRGPEYEQAAREAGACAFMLKDNLQPLPACLPPPLSTTQRPSQLQSHQEEFPTPPIKQANSRTENE